MRGVLRNLFAAAIAAGCLIGTPIAHAADEELDPVRVFNSICYSQVPNVANIEDMAEQLAWRALEDDEIEQFKTIDNPSFLRGWNMQVGERIYKVGVFQSKPSANMIKTFPDFKDGTATSCSLVLDDQMLAEKFMPNMQTLAGKEPLSRAVPEGELLTTTWAGGNDDLKVFLFAKSPPTGKGGLLNVTVLQK